MRKHLCVLFVIAFCCGSLYAQTSSGSLMVGGGLSFESETREWDDDYKYSRTSFIPSVGYFVGDQIAVGLSLGVTTERTENGGDETKSSTVMFGPFARYYVHTSNESFAFYGQVQLLYGATTDTDEDEDKTKGSELDFAVSPGFTYFFNERWALELGFRGIGVNVSDPNKDNENDKTTEFSIGLNSFAPNALGIRYYF